MTQAVINKQVTIKSNEYGPHTILLVINKKAEKDFVSLIQPGDELVFKDVEENDLIIINLLLCGKPNYFLELEVLTKGKSDDGIGIEVDYKPNGIIKPESYKFVEPLFTHLCSLIKLVAEEVYKKIKE